MPEKTYQINRNIHQSPNPWLYSRPKKKPVKKRPKQPIPVSTSQVKNQNQPSAVDFTQTARDVATKTAQDVATKTAQDVATQTAQDVIAKIVRDGNVKINPKIVESKDIVETVPDIVETVPDSVETVPDIAETIIEPQGYIGLAEEQHHEIKAKPRQSVEFLKPLKSQKSSLFYVTKDGITSVTHQGEGNLHITDSKLYAF